MVYFMKEGIKELPIPFRLAARKLFTVIRLRDFLRDLSEPLLTTGKYLFFHSEIRATANINSNKDNF